VLFDDLRTCLSESLAIDLDQLFVTGFSFGGLWSTFLTMERSETLAVLLLMSGGTGPFFLDYRTPQEQLPVMIMWGGASDTYGEGFSQVRFEDLAMDLSSRLRGDGHFVAHCDHGGGHTVPLDIHDILGAWIRAHRFGEASALQDGLGSMPSWCVIP
jgi:predicted esterase